MSDPADECREASEAADRAVCAAAAANAAGARSAHYSDQASRKIEAAMLKISIAHRFAPDSRIPEASLGDAHQARIRIRDLSEWLDKNLPDGREKSLTLTKLEETSHWAHAALRNDRKDDKE